MPFLAFFLLLCCHLLAGYGVLQLFRLRLKTAYTITLSLLLGVALASFLPFLLQLFYIPITGLTVFGSLALTMLLLNIPTAIRTRKEGRSAIPLASPPGALRSRQRRLTAVFRRFHPGPLRVRPYEIPYWMVIGFLIFVSVWRCYYFPVTSRDALSGPEAIAEFAVREHTLINSFFNIDLWSTNNQFKSPFLISLQVVYKMAGFPFGQVWLSIVFICLTVFLYHALTEKLHPVLAATLLLLFTMAPEPYAYTFMILYDYSNMVYFFLGLYFLFRSGSAQPTAQSTGSFYFAGLLLGIATYIRSETLILALLFLPPILLMQRHARYPFRNILVSDLLFFLPALIGYLLPVTLYVNHYLPVHYPIGALINPQLQLPGLFRRYADIFTHLLTGRLSLNLWGYFLYLAAILFAAEAILVRRFDRDARNWLYSIAILYLGLGFIGWLFPVMDLTDSTKRALFKMLPLALFYLANNQLLRRFSLAIARWEQSGPLRRARNAHATHDKPSSSPAPSNRPTSLNRPASSSRPASSNRPASSSRPASPSRPSAKGRRRK